MEKSWIPFGMGSRTCIGKHISLLEISKLIPTVVRKFDFELKMKGEEWETKEFWFAKQFGVFVTCGERWEERRES